MTTAVQMTLIICVTLIVLVTVNTVGDILKRRDK